MIKKLAVIGMGNMGKALVKGWLAAGVVKKSNLGLSNRSRHNQVVVKGAGVVVLAVKPQQMEEVVTQISKVLKKSSLLISVAAGVKIEMIKKWLDRRRQPVVRVMPNTPLLVGKGMSGWVCNREVTVVQKKAVKKLLGAVGEEIEFFDEKQIDKVTAISGSGPAYIFAVIEALTIGARKLGFSQVDAQQLVGQTFVGSASLLEKSGRSALELRKVVTSKGGTTEAAMTVLEQNNFKKVWQNAIQAAYRRAVELGRS